MGTAHPTSSGALGDLWMLLRFRIVLSRRRIMKSLAWAVTTFLMMIAALSAQEPSPRDQEAKAELQRLQGTWRFESLEIDGKATPAAQLKERTLVIGGNVFLVRQGEKVLQGGILRL